VVVEKTREYIACALSPVDGRARHLFLPAGGAAGQGLSATQAPYTAEDLGHKLRCVRRTVFRNLSPGSRAAYPGSRCRVRQQPVSGTTSAREDGDHLVRYDV